MPASLTKRKTAVQDSRSSSSSSSSPWLFGLALPAGLHAVTAVSKFSKSDMIQHFLPEQEEGSTCFLHCEISVPVCECVCLWEGNPKPILSESASDLCSLEMKWSQFEVY